MGAWEGFAGGGGSESESGGADARPLGAKVTAVNVMRWELKMKRNGGRTP